MSQAQEEIEESNKEAAKSHHPDKRARGQVPDQAEEQVEDHQVDLQEGI